jgi:aspartate ammonia-lyase
MPEQDAIDSPDAKPSAILEVATTQTVVLNSVNARMEHDLLGAVAIPTHAYWGVHSLRAVENFPITGVPIGHFPDLVVGIAMVKKAAARANRILGALSERKAAMIERACDALIRDHKFHAEFVVDAVQGGAGTSTNMNANEVIANLGLVLSGFERGQYDELHPNDDVNMAQSTNDAYPTAIRIAILEGVKPLQKTLRDLSLALKEKGAEFADVLKMGRTQLQDAVPMTLGQEFDAYHVTVKEDIQRLSEVAALFQEVNLGATAIGTGINADPRYAALVVEELAAISGHALSLAPNLIEATSDMGAFVLFSGVLKRIAVKLSKICNDLRLLSSGPRTGFGEINLPPRQAGSSIMPGKVNPVIPEVVNQVAFLVIGQDLTVTMCAEGGQLQLNPFEPTIAFCVLTSLRMLNAAVDTLTRRCIVGITANPDHCLELVNRSIGVITALGPTLGYEASSRVAKRALRENRGVREIVLEEGLIAEAKLDELLRIEAMTRPSRNITAHSLTKVHHDEQVNVLTAAGRDAEGPMQSSADP